MHECSDIPWALHFSPLARSLLKLSLSAVCFVLDSRRWKNRCACLKGTLRVGALAVAFAVNIPETFWNRKWITILQRSIFNALWTDCSLIGICITLIFKSLTSFFLSSNRWRSRRDPHHICKNCDFSERLTPTVHCTDITRSNSMYCCLCQFVCFWAGVEVNRFKAENAGSKRSDVLRGRNSGAPKRDWKRNRASLSHWITKA